MISFASFVRGIMKEFVRIEIRVRQLLVEFDPRVTSELLGDWERIYGLPEKCGTAPVSIEARRQALHAKMTSKDAGNIPFFLGLAATLGFPNAEIHRISHSSSIFTCVSNCNDALYNESGGWNDVWLFLFNDTNENDGTLQCLSRKFDQVHEIVIFEAPEDWSPPP